MRRIKTKIDLREGVAALGRFQVTRIILGQQLSIASANAIWGRLEAQLRPFTP